MSQASRQFWNRFLGRAIALVLLFALTACEGVGTVTSSLSSTGSTKSSETTTSSTSTDSASNTDSSSQSTLSAILAGDVTGLDQVTRVTAIQGQKVSTIAPSLDWQLLRWNSVTQEWRPDSFIALPPLSLAGGTLSLPQASRNTAGFLSSSDWSRFNAGTFAQLAAPNQTITGSMTVTGALQRACDASVTIPAPSPSPAISPTSAYRWTTGGSANIEPNQHCYLLYSQTLTWQEAQNRCQSIGGYLVTITSDEERQILFGLDRLNLASPSTKFWLGLTDIDEEGVWRWVTGEKSGIVGGSGSVDTADRYSQFDTAQPNGNGDCAYSGYVSYFWNDQPCSGILVHLIDNLLCERDF